MDTSAVLFAGKILIHTNYNDDVLFHITEQSWTINRQFGDPQYPPHQI